MSRCGIRARAVDWSELRWRSLAGSAAGRPMSTEHLLINDKTDSDPSYKGVGTSG